MNSNVLLSPTARNFKNRRICTKQNPQPHTHAYKQHHSKTQISYIFRINYKDNKMADIPVISITQVDAALVDDMDDNDYDTSDRRYSIHDVHTDFEDLDNDEELLPRCTSPNKMFVVSKRRYHRQSIDGAVTDIEDLQSDTDDDDAVDENEKYEKETFLLSEFLDHGTVSETTSGFSGARTGTRRIMRNNTKKRFSDAGEMTEYEHLDGSDDDDARCAVTPDLYNDYLTMSGGMNSISIHDSKRDRARTPATSESDMDEDKCQSRPKSAMRKSAPKPKRRFNVSNVEALEFTGQEAIRSGQAMKHSKSAMDAEELVFQSSDTEEYRCEKRVSFPDIDIKFGQWPTAEPSCVLRNRKHRQTTSSSSKSWLSVSDKNEDGATTDVENLNSDDDDENDMGAAKIPTAYIRPGDEGDTDVEDIDGDAADDSDNDDEKPFDIRMPSPMREMILVRENATGNPTCKVMPMLEPRMLGIAESYVDKGLTDTEDMSDVGEDVLPENDYVIEKIPNMDHGIVHSSENIRSINPTRKFEYCDPVTDTEDLNMGSQPTTSVVRRKKSKSVKMAAVSLKHRTFLDVRRRCSAEPVTDCEELSDDAHQTGRRRSSVMDDYVTDVEFMSGDEAYEELVSREIDAAALEQHESFYSTVTSKDGCSIRDKIGIDVNEILEDEDLNACAARMESEYFHFFFSFIYYT